MRALENKVQLWPIYAVLSEDICAHCPILEMHHNTTRRRSKQKICTNIDHHWSKKGSFLCVQTNKICESDVWRFCENGSDPGVESLIVTRVEPFRKKPDSSRVNDSNCAITAILHCTVV